MILDRILEAKREEVTQRRANATLEEVKQRSFTTSGPRDFAGALKSGSFGVIAEIKRRSPANGLLRANLDPGATAQTYDQGGALCMSVLTDGPFFDGSDADLVAARTACALPVLRKDFVIDAYQVWEARAIGADAVLLIVRALEQERLVELLGIATETGMSALVEVHDEPELQRALDAKARLIGVNNRNLDTLQVDIATSERVIPLIPDSIPAIAESGVSNRAAAERMRQAGARAILVGEALVLSEHPGELLRELSLRDVPVTP
jgi:indole-3-glycerol phosphate synthase